MRILYLDIDSLRSDHLSCYGYPRQTSPTIDRLAADSVRLDNCYTSDLPCLPSRTAFFTGRLGTQSGVVSHSGTGAEPFSEGHARKLESALAANALTSSLRQAGLRCASISPFWDRHSAAHLASGFHEIYNPGRRGLERADEITPIALNWLAQNAKCDAWFLHVNFYDLHAPYRTPPDFGHLFKNEPTPSWLTEEIRREHWHGAGPFSAQEILGLDVPEELARNYPRQPAQASSMSEVRRMFDGYDISLRYVDDHIGKIISLLEKLGVLDQTAIILSADHGVALGELNIYGAAAAADYPTSRTPTFIKWPGIKPRVDTAFHYQMDIAATVVDLLGGKQPAKWDAKSFASSLRQSQPAGRPFLVISQGTWTCQRAVRFDEYLCIRSYHHSLHGYPDTLLFNIVNDPQERHDLAERRPDLAVMALAVLEEWHMEMMRKSTAGRDPLWAVLSEGGPPPLRGNLETYAERLRKTGRSDLAQKIPTKRPVPLSAPAPAPKTSKPSKKRR